MYWNTCRCGRQYLSAILPRERHLESMRLCGNRICEKIRYARLKLNSIEWHEQKDKQGINSARWIDKSFAGAIKTLKF